MLEKSFIPSLPFPGFKWQWATTTCTEGLNDPVVLLGVLFRLRKLEPLGLKYSSSEFGEEMEGLARDIENRGIGINLTGRVGERNLIRNSGQYWRALDLIAPGRSSGLITLTEFGRQVADRKISQSQFAATIVSTLALPNERIQEEKVSKLWKKHGLCLRPLRLILSIALKLYEAAHEEGYIAPEELWRIVIPLSGSGAELDDYVNFISWHRKGEISLDGWPDAIPGANDGRMAREFLIFLSNYGYMTVEGEGRRRRQEKYWLNSLLIDEIKALLAQPEATVQSVAEAGQVSDIASEVERKRVGFHVTRPRQAQFRRAVLASYHGCIITNVVMPEVLEAAHIIPFKYRGEDTVANGFAMRTDIHILFDSGHLRISPEGKVELSERARRDYGATIPPRIVIPDFVDRRNLKWRWDNYNGY